MFLFLHKWSRKNFVLASYTYIYNKIYRRTWQDEVIFHRQDPDERSSRRMQPHEKHISLAGKCWTVGRSYWSSNGLDREFALFLRSTPIVSPSSSPSHPPPPTRPRPEWSSKIRWHDIMRRCLDTLITSSYLHPLPSTPNEPRARFGVINGRGEEQSWNNDRRILIEALCRAWPILRRGFSDLVVWCNTSWHGNP